MKSKQNSKAKAKTTQVKTKKISKKSQKNGAKLPVTYKDVCEASKRIKNVAHITPVMTSRTLDKMTGAKLFLKCENFQKIGALKFRGAYNALS